ncbi:hypothetical protein BSL78_07394 [Apostichopus japonicus]|uniref:Annexin n=1 Tax=Stichopus japonicus TaxID=307972 RepID=A0A2G8L619_STIJA|nr:hypothetical protein BSL78_07394 [Apostichopus japonicus]
MGKANSKEDGEASTEPATLEVPTEQTPTVLPQPTEEFNAQTDADNLSKAFQAFGNNESVITGILANRSWEQRQEIKDAYRTKFNKSLISEVENELSGHYRNALDSLLQDPDTVRANFINKIINDRLMTRLPDTRGKDIAILETIYPLTKTEMNGLLTTYEKVNGTQLFKEVEEKITGPFKEWVLSLTQTGRNEGMPSPQAIAKDVSYLKNLPPESWSPQTKELQQLLCKQSNFYLFSVFNTYELETGTKLLEVIEKLDSAKKEGLKVIVGACLNGYDFFAEGLYQSMKGFGTNDEKLIYIMIDRCEVAFEIKYKQSLESFLKGDTSGDYKHLLLAILECKQPSPPTENETS